MFKVKITALTTFLDGYDRYEEGKSYRVKRDRAWKFISLGWAKKGR